jgi:hypothetical protein
MKINKTRLLQIIREEVELHEKNSQSTPSEDLGAVSSETSADINNDGKLSAEEANNVIDAAIAGKMEEDTTEEDQIIKKGDGVIQPKPDKNKDKLEIRIR